MSDEQNERSEPIADKNGDVNESENVVDVAEEEYSLAEIEEMEEQARRLLAGQDSHSCTYAEGYRPRQCVYSCITCVPTGGAGICYGCSLLCHDGHDLVELFTKRRFKCDCGNGAFKDKCKLFEDKAPHNERNTYNHNFVNSYCLCKRPYPDEEATIQDSQLQCIACEDWFHLSHSGIPEEQKAEYSSYEYLCKECNDKLPFFAKVGRDVVDEETMTCSKETREEGDTSPVHLLKTGWRKKLCDCPKCEDLYDKFNCDWIHDPDDSLEKFDEEASKKIKEEDEESEKELTKFMQAHDKDVVVNVITEMNVMKRKMREFAERMESMNEVVTPEHIKELFEGLKRERQMKFNERMEEISEGKGRINGDEDRMRDAQH